MDYQLERKNVEWITSWIEGYKMDYKYRTEGMQNELLAGQKGVEWITSQIEWYRMDYKYRIEGMQNELLARQKGVYQNGLLFVKLNKVKSCPVLERIWREFKYLNIILTNP